MRGKQPLDLGQHLQTQSELVGSISVTVEGYGLHHFFQAGDPYPQHLHETTGLPVIETYVPAAVWPFLRGIDNLVDHSCRGTRSHPESLAGVNEIGAGESVRAAVRLSAIGSRHRA